MVLLGRSIGRQMLLGYSYIGRLNGDNNAVVVGQQLQLMGGKGILACGMAAAGCNKDYLAG